MSIVEGKIEANNIVNNPPRVKKIYYRLSGQWIELYNHKNYPSNCKNCGAPLHRNMCEYCGTEY